MQGTRSVLQSGNVVFRTDLSKTAELERLLKDAADKRLALRTDFFVRTAQDWEGIIARNLFPDEAARDPSHLLVMFLKDTPDRTAVTALQQAITGREVVRAEGRQVYIVYPDGVGPLAALECRDRKEARHPGDRSKLEHNPQAGFAREVAMNQGRSASPTEF
jgi:uncharacterized protein (DUF1697 family)